MNSTQAIRFLIGRFLAAIGDQFLMFSAPLIVYQATGSVAKSGLAFFIEWTPRILSLPICGFLADRISHRALYFTADIGRFAICMLGCILLVYKAFDPFLIISTMMAFMAVFNSMAFITVEATVPRLFSADELPRAQTLLQGMDQLSQVAGPALAALFLSYFSRNSLVGFAAIGFIVSALNIHSLYSMKSQASTATAPISVRDFLAKLNFGFNFFISKRDLIILSLLACVVNLVMGTTLAQVAPIVTGLFGRSDQFFGGMTTLAAILSIITFTQIPKIAKRFKLKILGIFSLTTLVIAGLLLSLSNQIWAFVLGYCLLVCSCAVFNVFMRTWRAQIIPREHLGKVIGILVLINNSTLPLSGILVAAFSTKISSQNIILISAFTLLTVSSYLTFKLKELES